MVQPLWSVGGNEGRHRRGWADLGSRLNRLPSGVTCHCGRHVMPPAASRSRSLATPVQQRVSLLALPDAVVSTLAGIYDVMNARALRDGTARPPFEVQIVGETVGPLELASGVPIHVQRGIDSIDASDIVIVPSVLLPDEGWRKGRYPRLVEWITRMHAGGALLCSACSGIFLLAETGVFDSRNATVHFNYART